MPVLITKLMFDPESITVGDTDVTCSFSGILDFPNENTVTFTLFIDPLAPVFLVNENGVSVNSLSWKQDLATTWSTPDHDITIRVNAAPPVPSKCNLRLEAVDNQGHRSSDTSSVIVH